MLKKVLIVLVVLLVALVALGFVAPNTLSVESSVVIAAEPASVHRHIADLRTWPEWSAWTQARDPQAEFEFSGPQSGVGAVWAWRGAEDGLGVGRLEITESDPATGIAYDLEFDDGALQAPGAVRLDGSGEGTTVTWEYEGELGPKPLGGLLKLLLGSMIQAQIAGDFETGLQGLKQRVEGAEASGGDE